MTRLPNQDTIPTPPPEGDGSVLHVMTLGDAMQTIEVLRERESELRAELLTATIDRDAWKKESHQTLLAYQGERQTRQELAARITQLETELAQLRAERR